jgi:hypothetical protein
VLGERIVSATDAIRIESDGGTPGDALYARVLVGVAGADRTDVLVRLRSGVSLSGRLVIETPEDRAALEMRRSALEVLAQPAEAGPAPRSARSITPLKGPSLDFTLADLLPGDYVLRMYADSGRIKSVIWGGRDYTGLPFTVADRDISGVVITVTPEAARAEGIVRDSQGHPARHAAVIHFPADPARWRRYGPQPERLRSVPVRTSTYAIQGVPAGEYYLVAVDEALANSWRDPSFLEAASKVAARVTLAWGETLTRDLVITEVRP